MHFRKRNGSYSLEAGLVLPLLFLLFFSLIYLAMHVYQHAVLLEAAVASLRQTADQWGTGRSDPSHGLYWRLTDDRSDSADTQARLVQAQQQMGTRAELLSLKQAAKGPAVFDFRFENLLVRRTLTVQARQRLFGPASPLYMNLMGDQAWMAAAADIAEPAEYIRNCDLTADYLQSISQCYQQFEEQSGEPGVIASYYPYDPGREEKKYHIEGIGCPSAANIKYRIRFDSEADAAAHGYTLCRDCAKRRTQ